MLRSYQRISPGPRHFEKFRNNKIFYGEGLSAPRPTPKLKDHPLSAVSNCLFNIFAATLRTRRTSLHAQPEDAHAVVTRDPLKMSPLPAAYKILYYVLLSRLTSYMNEIIGDHQCGFHRNRSTTDQNFYIWQILEKKWEYNWTVYQLFIDFKKASDSIKKDAL
jgi:hypothetical protein